MASRPDWLGSPQHAVAGALLAAAVVVVSRYGGLCTWLAGTLAIGTTCTAELVVELVEYPLLYGDRFHRSAYYDTLADMASTIIGAVAGSIAAAYLLRKERRRPLPAAGSSGRT